MIHSLKTHPEFYEAVADGSKPFEVRNDDRGYALGDTLELNEWDPDTTGTGGVFTGRSTTCLVTYVLHDGRFGIASGTVVMGIRILSATSNWPQPQRHEDVHLGRADREEDMNTYNLVHKPPSNAVVETTYEAYVSVFTKDECLYQGNSEIPILPPPDGCVAILDAELDLVCYAPIEKAMVIAAILNTYKEPT